MKKFVGRAVAMMAAHPGPFSLFWVTTLLQLAYKVDGLLRPGHLR